MNVSREMPKYECHKKVWALKIAGIVGDQHGGVYFQPAEDGYDKVPLTPTNVVEGREARVHRMPPSPDRWKERSRTFAGIAEAMASQWGREAALFAV